MRSPVESVPSLLAEAPLIRFSHVRMSFGEHVVFDDLTLDVRVGETLTIIGASGSGKSVALKLVIGLLQPDSGSITYRGREVTTMSVAELITLRSRVGMLFQSGAVFDSMSVADNVAYGVRERASVEQLTESAIAERVTWALSLVGLPGIESMMPSELSGGMRKRVGLARAIAVRPEALLFDEPTTGLDPINASRIARVIAGLQRQLRLTSVVVTHDMKTALSFSDRLAMIRDGRVVLSGTPDDFRRSTDPDVAAFVGGEALPPEPPRRLSA